MTFVAKHREGKMLSRGRAVFAVLAFCSLTLILFRSEIAIQYVTRGLLLCARTVIPSLFPFMVLSEIIVVGGLGSRLLERITAPMGRLLRLPRAGCTAVLLGMLCGFPVGAKCATLAWEQGDLTDDEAERTVACANNPSSAFLISAVGISLWENRRFGVALYVCVLLASLLVGILIGRLSKKTNTSSEKPPIARAVPPLSAHLFTDAIASATRSILLVCAYVIFFSAFVGTLGSLLDGMHLPQATVAALFSLFELSGGVSQTAALGNTLHAAILTALAVGWSGLSVHCQVLSVCDGTGLSLRPYLVSKLLSALLCALLFGILLVLCPELMIPATVCGR